MTTVPKYISITNPDVFEFDPSGAGLPIIGHEGTLVTIQGNLDAIVAAAAALDPPILLAFSDSAPAGGVHLDADPYVRYDKAQGLTTPQLVVALGNVGLTKQTGTPAVATDLATALVLLNAIRAKLISSGLFA